MSYSMTPIAPVQELSINSVRLGAVRSFSEQTVGVPIPVHAIGQSLPIGVVRSVAHYEVRVSRLLTDKRVFSETLSPHMSEKSTTSFTADLFSNAFSYIPGANFFACANKDSPSSRISG